MSNSEVRYSAENSERAYRGPLGSLRGVFEAARAAAGEGMNFHFRLAGATVRIRFAGMALGPLLTPSLSHLAVGPEARPSLTVHVWDDASTGVVTPLLVPAASCDDSGQATYYYRLEETQAALESASGLLSAIDHGAGAGFLRAASLEALPARERSSPLRLILSWWAARRGLQVAHASAVGTPAGGVLLVGPAGSGKSTTALACLGSALGYAADDCCLISVGNQPRVFSMYASAKIARQIVSWFPNLETMIAAAPESVEGEALLFLGGTFGEALVREFRLRAVVSLRLGGAGPTRLEPATATRALEALAPSTIFQFPGSGADTLMRLARAVRRTACYTLTLGPDITRVPEVIGTLLEELG